MTLLQCHNDFDEHNQVLGQVNNNSKLITEALGVSNETFERKPEFQQQKERHGVECNLCSFRQDMEKVLRC